MTPTQNFIPGHRWSYSTFQNKASPRNNFLESVYKLRDSIGCTYLHMDMCDYRNIVTHTMI